MTLPWKINDRQLAEIAGQEFADNHFNKLDQNKDSFITEHEVRNLCGDQEFLIGFYNALLSGNGYKARSTYDSDASLQIQIVIESCIEVENKPRLHRVGEGDIDPAYPSPSKPSEY